MEALPVYSPDMIGTAVFVLGILQGATKGGVQPLPVKGLHLSAPKTSNIGMLTNFIRKSLPKEGVNTLVLEFDYRFKFKKHPEVADGDAYSIPQVQEIVSACKDAHIRLIPQINLLGHQSWDKTTESLLIAHPEFDETRGKYPNNKGIYCRSYCPNAPGLHAFIFDLVDELCDACEADAFHAGLDEVFILADPDCPNCKGKNSADVFAGEVNVLHDHLQKSKRQMWMWGDRFLDGRSNGLGEWEASTNGTYTAINKVPRDIVICDWHYEHAEPTPAFFAVTGLPVVASPWRRTDLALQQLAFIESLRKSANGTLSQNAKGMLHTTWCEAEAFIRAYDGDKKQEKSAVESSACFKSLFRQIRLNEQWSTGKIPTGARKSVNP